MIGRLEPLTLDHPLWAVFVGELVRAQLPSADLGEDGEYFRTLVADGAAIAFGGYGRYGRDALLRSIVVAPASRQRGAGRRICSALLDELREKRAETVWLLTTTAPSFFERLGFRPCARSSAPPAIAATQEFSSLCPACAVSMCLILA